MGGPSPLGLGPPSSDSQLVGRQGAWAAPSNALPSGPRQRGLRLNGVADKISERELVPLVPEERRPCQVRGKKGLAVSGQQPQDHLRDDPAADRTEAPLAAAGRGLGQDVVPQRRRCAVEPKVIVVQPRLTQGFGHVLTRWQSHGSAPHEVSQARERPASPGGATPAGRLVSGAASLVSSRLAGCGRLRVRLKNRSQSITSRSSSGRDPPRWPASRGSGYSTNTRTLVAHAFSS